MKVALHLVFNEKYAMRTLNNKILILFVIVFRLFVLFCSLNLVSDYTKLGDTATYLSGTAGASGYFDDYWWLHSTKLMNVVAHSLYLLGGEIIAHIVFLMLSIYGIFYPLNKLNLTKFQFITAITLLSLPSFSIWTSMVSKESVLVFTYGILLGMFIEWWEKKKKPNLFYLMSLLYLAFLFKPHYTLALMIMILFVYVVKKLNLNFNGQLIIFLLAILTVFTVIFLMRDYFNWLAFEMPKHFNPHSRSTRVADFWLNENDFFAYAPMGMFIALWGPTLPEVLNSPLHLGVFLESGVLLFSLILFTTYCLSNLSFLNKHSFGLLLGFFLGFLAIAFVHYPFGVMNPGSAIRYRSGFYSFYVIAAFFVYGKISENFQLKNY